MRRTPGSSLARFAFREAPALPEGLPQAVYQWSRRSALPSDRFRRVDVARGGGVAGASHGGYRTVKSAEACKEFVSARRFSG